MTSVLCGEEGKNGTLLIHRYLKTSYSRSTLLNLVLSAFPKIIKPLLFCAFHATQCLEQDVPFPYLSVTVCFGRLHCI